MLALCELLCSAAAMPSAPPCDGYVVAGAGDAASNGCYTVHRGTGTYVKDAAHSLYAFGGVWRLAHD